MKETNEVVNEVSKMTNHWTPKTGKWLAYVEGEESLFHYNFPTKKEAQKYLKNWRRDWMVSCKIEKNPNYKGK